MDPFNVDEISIFFIKIEEVNSYKGKKLTYTSQIKKKKSDPIVPPLAFE